MDAGEKHFNIEGINNYNEFLKLIEDHKKTGVPLWKIINVFEIIKLMLSTLTQINGYLKAMDAEKKTDHDCAYVQDMLFENELLTFFSEDYKKEIEKAIVDLNKELLEFDKLIGN